MDEDTGFINALVASPNDIALRLVYADWLDDRGDPRGEYLRLALELDHLEGQGSPQEQRAKLQYVRSIGRCKTRLSGLLSQIPPDWLGKLHRGRIEACRMTFVFEDEDPSPKSCPGWWQQLSQSAVPSARSCEICSREVRLCRSVREVEQAIRGGHPVAKAPAFERVH